MKNLLHIECSRIKASRNLLISLLILLILHIAFCYTICETRDLQDSNDYFSAQMHALITRTESNLFLLEQSDPHSFTARYDRLILDACNNTKSLIGLLPMVSGWDQVLLYNGGNILLLLACILFANNLFYEDCKIGIKKILLSTKKGRISLFFAKLIIFMVFSLVISFVFTLLTMLVVATKTSLVGFFAPIQSFPAFSYSPRVLLIWEAVLERILQQALLSAVVGLLSTIPALILNHALFSIIFTSLYYGTQHLLNINVYYNITSFLQHCNLIAALDTSKAYTKLICVDIGIGFPVKARLLIIAGTIFFALLLAFWTGYLYVRPAQFSVRSYFSQRNRNNITRYSPSTKKTHTSRLHGHSMLYWEIQKTILNKPIICILVCLIMIKAGTIFWDFYNNPISDHEVIYREYMTQHGGAIQTSTSTFIQQEQARLEAALHLRAEIMNLENLREDELQALWLTINDATQREEPFAEFSNHYKSIIAETDDFKRSQLSIVYDTGWNKVLNNGYDSLCYLCIALISSVLFTQESETNFFPILYTTSCGRSNTFKKKIIWAMLFAGTLSLIFWGSDIIYCIAHYSLPNSQAKLISLEQYRHVPVCWTLKGYLVTMTILRVFMSMLFTLLFSCMSIIINNSILTFFSTLIVVPFPALLFNYSVPSWRPSDFLDVNPILYMGFAIHPWLEAIILFSYLFICAFFVMLASKQYSEKVNIDRL